MHLPSIMSYINLPLHQSLNYAPSFGIPKLRETWQQLLFKKNPSLAGKKISLPIVTNAITHALSVTAEMWIDESDVVLLPDKIWGNVYPDTHSFVMAHRSKTLSFFHHTGIQSPFI